MATASWDHSIKLWDAETGKETANLVGSDSSVYALAFSADGRQLAAATAQGSVSLWDMKTKKRVQEVGKHADAVWAVAFSSDGKYLASGSSDKTAKLWPLGGGKEAATLLTSLEMGKHF